MSHDLFGIGILVILIGISVWNWNRETKIWNGGICKETGLPWKVVANSGSITLYESCDRRVWIDSYFVKCKDLS